MSVFRQSVKVIGNPIFLNLSAISRTDVRQIKRWVGPTLRELQRRSELAKPELPKPRSSFLEWNYESELFALGKRIGEELDRSVLKMALTHRSYVIQQELKLQEQGLEVQEKIPDNTLLIRKGEEIISSCISVTLQNKYPDVVVKAIENYLMSQEVLSYVGSHIGLKDVVLCAEFPVEDRTLASSFKAIVGAIEEGSVENSSTKNSSLKAMSGSERAELFVKDFLISQLNGKDLFELWDPKDPYEHLKKLAKEKGLSEVEPRLCSQSATNTILANYQVGLYCQKKLIGLGWGESVDIAKDTAAFDAIKNIYTNKL